MIIYSCFFFCFPLFETLKGSSRSTLFTVNLFSYNSRNSINLFSLAYIELIVGQLPVTGKQLNTATYLLLVDFFVSRLNINQAAA